MCSSASRQGPLATDLLSDSKVLLLTRAGCSEQGFTWPPAALGWLKDVGLSQMSSRPSGSDVSSSLECSRGVSSRRSAWI